MEDELLGPGVQHGEHADRAADLARIAGQLDDRLGGGLHQRAIAVALMAAQGGAQLLGHGDGDVEVGAAYVNELRVLGSFVWMTLG